MLVKILIVILTVAAMELFAYAAHRWIMHGKLGWGWHKSHHEPHRQNMYFEKNDLYGIVMSGVAITLFALGAAKWWPLTWVALGMTIYGFIYFFVHDGLVHQRWPFRAVPKRGYLRRLYQAHRMHHAVEGREDCVSFGFLYAPPVDKLKAELRESKVLDKRQSQHPDAWRPDADKN